MVKAAPRLATILCRWLGRLAMPIGEALSAVAGAMVDLNEGGRRKFDVNVTAKDSVKRLPGKLSCSKIVAGERMATVDSGREASSCSGEMFPTLSNFQRARAGQGG